MRALGDADLGAVPATATNVSGSTTIEVTCPTGTPYHVGLQPSNGDMAGAGVLTGTGGNSDQPTYQLRSQTGPDGTIWGNTATRPTSAMAYREPAPERRKASPSTSPFPAPISVRTSIPTRSR